MPVTGNSHQRGAICRRTLTLLRSTVGDQSHSVMCDSASQRLSPAAISATTTGTAWSKHSANK